jgi:hypothetical protein
MTFQQLAFAIATCCVFYGVGNEFLVLILSNADFKGLFQKQII